MYLSAQIEAENLNAALIEGQPQQQTEGMSIPWNQGKDKDKRVRIAESIRRMHPELQAMVQEKEVKAVAGVTP